MLVNAHEWMMIILAESKEDKKKRKAAVKEAKKERRIEKKETQAAFATEFKHESRKTQAQTVRLHPRMQ